MAPDRPTALVVDSDSATIAVLTGWLEAANIAVRTAADGREALAAIKAECPEFLVTDWDLPHTSGMELCRWLRSQKLPRYVYTILLTARTDSHDLVIGLESGADEFVRKPINKDELLARIRAGLRVLALESRLSLLAQCDSLTGLWTQRTFFERLDRKWSRAPYKQLPLSCVMVDLDFFKRVNDTYGHRVGDEVIRRVASILKSNVREGDLVSRYGGEEFCVLLCDRDERIATDWAEQIRRLIAETSIAVGDRSIQITASFGVAQRLADTANPDELVDLADQALLVSKGVGRDRVTAYQTMNDSGRVRATNSRASALDGIVARDVMTTIVAGLHEREKIGRAVEYFLQLRINSAPVVDDDGRLVGVLTEKDAMAILLWPHWWTTTIADVMKKGVVTYEENTPALMIYEFLCRVSVRSVVVVDRGRPTGVISRASLLRWFTNSLVARGESTGLEGLLVTTASAQGAKQRITEIAAKLAETAQSLAHDLDVDADALAPRLVGGASQVQELANDLLGYSRYLHADRSTGNAMSILAGMDAGRAMQAFNADCLTGNGV